MTKAFPKLQSLVYPIAVTALIVLSACTSFNKPKASVQDNNQEPIPSASNEGNTNKMAQPYQGDLTNVDALLKQSKKTEPKLKESSQMLYELALKAQAEGDWGAAVKGFGESISFMPNNEALLGYATAQAMSNVYTNDPKETLETKLRNFRDAIKGYQTATEFSQQANKPLTAEQKQLIEVNVACLKAFLEVPDPGKTTCDLVADALKVSNIK